MASVWVGSLGSSCWLSAHSVSKVQSCPLSLQAAIQHSQWQLFSRFSPLTVWPEVIDTSTKVTATSAAINTQQFISLPRQSIMNKQKLEKSNKERKVYRHKFVFNFPLKASTASDTLKKFPRLLENNLSLLNEFNGSCQTARPASMQSVRGKNFFMKFRNSPHLLLKLSGVMALGYVDFV